MTVIQLAIMLFTILLSSFVIVSANPFHKYPFVFLLDVGNEELETVNTKQIRVSAPGGSMAVRYPAIGDGETIAHLRVSGIDFGTDLKASIISGGPGYKFVVLVFMGNEGVNYDAVVTIQTVPVQNAVYSSQTSTVRENTYANQRYESQNINVNMKNEIELDENDSSEELTDENSNQNINSNAELSQSSSNVYYLQDVSTDNNEERSSNLDDEDDYENSVHQESNILESSAQNADLVTNEVINNDDDDDIENEGDINSHQDNDTEVEIYDHINASKDESNEEPVRIFDNNLYDKYEALKPHFFNNFNVYPQEGISQNARPIESPESKDFEDPSYLEQTYNGEEIHDDSPKDNNNNYSNSDYGSIDYKK